jgi:AraC-like DNA-binding protein
LELVRTAALTGYFDVAESLGLDTRALLRDAGLTRAMLTNPEQMLPGRSVIGLLERSAELSGCITFGLRMAEQRSLADLGIVSLLIAHQLTLRDALAVLTDYRNRINSTLVLHIDEHDDVAVLREEFAFSPPVASRQSNDLALGVLAALGGAVLGPAWRPHCITFSYERPAPAERDVYRRLFDCPVEFGAEHDGIIIERRLLDAVNPRADAALAAHARSLVEAMMGPVERTLAQEVEESIMLRLPAGRASIGATADALGMNVRTLQRRLRLERTGFTDLLERVRAQQAARYLANPRLRLTDVADLLGYASLAAFSRWHVERFGESASAARKRLPRAGAVGSGHRPAQAAVTALTRPP